MTDILKWLAACLVTAAGLAATGTLIWIGFHFPVLTSKHWGFLIGLVLAAANCAFVLGVSTSALVGEIRYYRAVRGLLGADDGSEVGKAG